MKYIDMHCDSLLSLFIKDREKAQLYESPYSVVDFKRLKQGDAMAQFFAIFLPPESFYEYMKIKPVSDEEYIATLWGYFKKNIAEHSAIIQQARNSDEIIANNESGKISAVLSIEDGRAVNQNIDNIKRFYDMGVRAITILWNDENCFGFPNSDDPKIMSKGLKDFGKEAVVYMQDLGILVDVSHLSDGGFYDVIKLCKKPIVATHSNSRAIAPHRRNLSDDMIKTLADHGGVTGINFGPEFSSPDVNNKDISAAMLAKHARYITNIGGIECLGIGSDYDGFPETIEVTDPSKMYILHEALRKEDFSEEDIEKIFSKNVMRLIKESVK